MSKIVNPSESSVKNPKGRLYCVLFWGLTFCVFWFAITSLPLVSVYIDDPNPTPTSLKYYTTSITGEPRYGIDYSANPVYPIDSRLQFRDIPFRIGHFEKKIQYRKNGERLESFNPPTTRGLLYDEIVALRER